MQIVLTSLALKGEGRRKIASAEEIDLEDLLDEIDEEIDRTTRLGHDISRNVLGNVRGC